jgi:hypothetical protein
VSATVQELDGDIQALAAAGGVAELTHTSDDNGQMGHLLIQCYQRPDGPMLRAWIVDFYRRFEGLNGTGSPVRVSSARFDPKHPLLLLDIKEAHDLFFAAAPADPESTAAALREAHRRISGGFADIPRYLNTQLPNVADFLRKGNGLVARGPLPLLDAYRAVLESHQCRPSLIREIGGSPNIRPPSSSKVLVLSPDVAIRGDNFEFTRTNSKARVAKLIDKWRGW